MDHVPLDRAGADDRDLDHQIVEDARFETREHVHLRAALHLEHAERVPLAEHVIDRRVISRDIGQVSDAQHGEAFADAGEHAQCQHIDLHHAQGRDIVLVPFDEAAVCHRGGADRHGLIEPAIGEHEAADMLREMPGQADQSARERDAALDQRVGGVDPGLYQTVAGP